MARPETIVPPPSPLAIGTQVKYVGTFWKEYGGPATILSSQNDWLKYDGENNGSIDGKRYMIHTENGDETLQWVRRQSLRLPGERAARGTAGI